MSLVVIYSISLLYSSPLSGDSGEEKGGGLLLYQIVATCLRGATGGGGGSRKLLLSDFAALQEREGGGGDRTLWKSISKRAWASSIFALEGYVWKQDLEDRRASKQY